MPAIIQDKIYCSHHMLKQQSTDAGTTSIAVFKSSQQVDVSVNNFLYCKTIGKDHHHVGIAAASSAASPAELLRGSLENTVSENLAGNHDGFMRQIWSPRIIEKWRSGCR